MKNKNIEKELGPIVAEITQLAKSVTKDFKDNPTDISGSTIQIHEDSPYMDASIPNEGWKRVLNTLPIEYIKKNSKKQK